MLSFINNHYLFQQKIMDKSWCHHHYEHLYHHHRHPMMLKYFHTADLAFNCFPSLLSKYWCSCFLFRDSDDDVNAELCLFLKDDDVEIKRCFFFIHKKMVNYYKRRKRYYDATQLFFFSHYFMIQNFHQNLSFWQTKKRQFEQASN